jgi:hypothetical protein
MQLKLIFQRAAFSVSALFVLSATQPSGAQSSGAVPGSCSINAAANTLTCTTTVNLSGVTGAFNANALTLSGQSAGPACSGGLTATPSTGLTPNTATQIALQACPGNTNRNSLNFRWVSPATAASGQDPWFGSATVTLAAAATTQVSVDVCASADAGAACTRVNASVSASGAAFACGAVSPASQTVLQNASVSSLTISCPGATSYQWYTGASPASGVAISGATLSTYVPSTANVGTTTYSARAFNSNQVQADSTSAATVTVQQQQTSGNCPAGEPRVSATWNNTPVGVNYRYQAITGNGVHVLRLTVASGMSSVGLTYPPSVGYTQDDTTVFSDKAVIVSQNCGAYLGANGQVVGGGQLINYDVPSGVINLVTAGDPRASQYGYATITPNSTWYVITQNQNCPAGTNCSFTGIFRNWNF